jgi:8-oxo-dGTP diphosphatase
MPRRELFEETGFTGIEMEQLYTFTDVDRDPRGRTISIAYAGIVDASDRVATAGDDAENAQWFNIKSIPELAFDHDLILKLAMEKLALKK